MFLRIEEPAMDLLGHCEIAMRCGLHEPEEVFGDGLLDLMLPNLLHCHDWAYSSMWCIEDRPEELRKAALLVRSHMVADWTIHYGIEGTQRKRKCGWAYQRMGVVRAECDRIFAEARAGGLLLPHASVPTSWSKKQLLDFLHSIVEYSLDVLLADSLPERHFRRLKGTLAALGGPDKRIWKASLYGRFHAFGAWSEHTEGFLEHSMAAFARDGYLAQRPDDFAVTTVIRKYAFVDDPAAHVFVRRFLQRIAEDMDSAEVDAMMDEVAAVASNPMSIYSGNYAADPPSGHAIHA
jgi:hypothetical protein